MGTNELQTIADRLAIQDVVLRYFELVDSKKWDQLDEAFTADTTCRWTPESIIEGCDGLAGALRAMSGSSEIVTYHHVASMTPIVDGDTAEVTVRVRAMHYGVGPRTGKFYESLGVQPTRLVRTPDGWRIKHHDWNIVVKNGSMEELFAPELAARRRQ